jgi:Protein of unknown function (DUF2914)
MDNRSDDRIAGWRRYERDLKGHLRPLGPPPPLVTSVPPRRAGGVLILALLIVFIVAGLAVTFYLEQSPDSSVAELFGNKPVAFQANERSGPVADRPVVPPADGSQAGTGRADGTAANRPGESAGGDRPFAGTNLNLDPQTLAAPGSNERAADRWRPAPPPEPTADDTPAATETDSTAAAGDSGDGADKTATEASATDVASLEASTTAGAPAASPVTDAPVAAAVGAAGAGGNGTDRPSAATEGAARNKAAEGGAGNKAAESGGGESASAPPAKDASAEPRSFADIVRAALGGDAETPTAPAKVPAERAQPPAADRTAAREPVALDGAVTRAQLTTNVRDREPVDRLGSVVDLPPGGGTLYFFTDLKGLGGQTVTHTWYYNRTPVQTVDLRIGSDRWRTYTKKRIDPNTMGAWKVVMTDQKTGRVLASQEFEVR